MTEIDRSSAIWKKTIYVRRNFFRGLWSASIFTAFSLAAAFILSCAILGFSIGPFLVFFCIGTVPFFVALREREFVFDGASQVIAIEEKWLFFPLRQKKILFSEISEVTVYSCDVGGDDKHPFVPTDILLKRKKGWPVLMISLPHLGFWQTKGIKTQKEYVQDAWAEAEQIGLILNVPVYRAGFLRDLIRFVV